MSATSEPKTNQMDTSPAVTASTMRNTTSAATQNAIVPEGGITEKTSLILICIYHTVFSAARQ